MTTSLTHMVRTLSTSLALLGALSFTGCADENDPKTWVKRLEDPAQRAPAVKRLSQFFEDKMAQTNKNREDPQVAAIVDVAAEPMAKVYTSAQLDERTRKELIKVLADMRDPRTAPALAKALNEYEPGKSDEDLRYAVQSVGGMAAAGKLTDQNLIDALWTSFSNFKVSKAKSINLVTDLHDAVLAVKHPSYANKAQTKIEAPVDPNAPDARDQLEFWQMTSVQILGELKHGAAAKPLVAVLLTPQKGSLRAVAQSALLKMPKESEPVLIAALNGTDADLAKLTTAFGPEKTHVGILADAIAYQTRPAGKEAILQALAAADNDSNRAVLAQSLIRYPSDPKIVAAYQAAYSKIGQMTSVALLGGENAHAALLMSSSVLYDPSLTDWVLKELEGAKGDYHELISLKALEAAIKLMTPEKAGAVGAAAKKHGTPREEEMHKLASAVVTKCKVDAACYVKLLDEPIPTGQGAANTSAIKAAWMAAIYGNDQTKTDLLAKIDKVRDPGARLAVVQAIGKLAGPKGDANAATQLEKMVEKDSQRGDKSRANDAVIKVAHALRARAL